VTRLVFLDDLRWNPAAVADFDPAALSPGANFGTVLAMSRCSALGTRYPAGHLARPVGEPLEYLIEFLAVLLAQVDLIVPAVEAERARHLLAIRDLF
jgi:hypothetical protein